MMSKSIGAEQQIPSDLHQLPQEVVASKPATTRTMELPLEELSWQNFERLIYRLASREADVDQCSRYGRSGQAQQGIDVFGRLNTGKYLCWQAKNYSRVDRADIEEAVSTFIVGTWAARSDRFTLCVRARLS